VKEQGIQFFDILEYYDTLYPVDILIYVERPGPGKPGPRPKKEPRATNGI
jgi:hypothetical protein